MNAVNFLLESGISLALLSLIYILALRKETFFRINRIFLLFSVAFSIVLPFVRLRVFDPQPLMLSEITVTPYRNLLEAVTIYSRDFSGVVEQTLSSSRIIAIIYLAGLLFFLGRLILRMAQIALLTKRYNVQQAGQFKFVYIEKEFSPFSFLNYIFINPENKQIEGYEKMVAHEMEHIKQGHTVDVLILEIMSIFQWFNPFMWLLKRIIRENHEFLADQAVLKSGVNPARYKQLLLNQVVGFQLEIANNFNSSLIKNRIKMISKIRSPKLANIKFLLGIIIALALVVAFACEQKESAPAANQPEIAPLKTTLENGKLKLEGDQKELEKVKEMFFDEGNFEITKNDSLGCLIVSLREAKELAADEEVFFIVEDMPEFPGGDIALRKFIANSVEYPEVAQENGIQGKVYVTFVVAKDGSIANAKIARSVNPSLDKEALRVVNSLPKWKPGVQKGQPVNVSFTVPINFVLQ